MNRAERRARSRPIKGGGRVHISIHHGPQPEPSSTPYLDYAVKAGREAKKGKVMRSKQVPGY